MKTAVLFLCSIFLCSKGYAVPVNDDPEALFRSGKIAEGVSLVRKKMTADPGNMESSELMIDLLLSAGRADQAMEFVAEMLRVDPLNANLHYLYGRAVPDAKRAQTSYERALKISPDHARSHMGMGAVYQATGKLQESIDAYKRARTYDSLLSEAWVAEIRSRLLFGDQAGAFAVAKEALSAVPREPSIYLTLAAMQPKGSVDLLKTGLVKCGEDPRLYQLLADASLHAGNGKEALAAAERAIELDPTNITAHRSQWIASDVARGYLKKDAIGTVFLAYRGLASGNSKTLATFEKLAAENRSSSVVYSGLGAALRAVRRNEDAKSALLLANELSPDHAEVVYQLGMLALEAGAFEEALRYLSVAYQKRPWDRQMGTAVATAMVKNNQIAAAEQVVVSLYKTDPRDVAIIVLYSDILVRTERAKQAYQLLSQAINGLKDPRLVAALVMAAPAAGKGKEAAKIVDEIAKQTNSQRMRNLAEKLRNSP